ncbi:hypothetical protein ABIE78_002686 [Sinorhizobium fredii]|uniref:Uncharacterized protein n=1 Tax=Sinorhizobium fredii (strain USDA 257) TaxID=1185652 RepID=I3X6H4_SINF2|nr:hypothetical protein USDA257_c29090 [Sinorhizobium fredii USDA 257]
MRPGEGHHQLFPRLRFLAALAGPAIILALAIAASEWLTIEVNPPLAPHTIAVVSH